MEVPNASSYSDEPARRYGHTFDVGDPQAVARAKAHFDKLTSKGYRAVALGSGGQPGVLLRTFDPSVKEVLFVPQLQGG